MDILQLQGDAKHKGNSLFVDENFEAYRNQWANQESK